MAEKIRIHMMGVFAIQADKSLYDDLPARSHKGVSLLQYLILERGKPVSAQRLIRELWGGRRSESPENAL